MRDYLVLVVVLQFSIFVKSVRRFASVSCLVAEPLTILFDGSEAG